MVKKSPAHKDPVLAGLTPEQQQRAETYKAILVKGVNSWIVEKIKLVDFFDFIL